MKSALTLAMAIAFPLLATTGCKEAAESAEKPRAEKTEARAEACKDCGVISSISPRKVKGEGSGIGAVTGAVIGGVVGHQIGGGRGKDVATGVGVLGGAVAGHEIEKETNSRTVYDIVVQMENGGVRRFTFGSDQSLRAGDRVRVSGDRVTRI